MAKNKIARMAIIDGGVGVIAMEKPIRCGCGRAAMLVVNRDGATRCVACDIEYQKKKEVLVQKSS